MGVQKLILTTVLITNVIVALTGCEGIWQDKAGAISKDYKDQINEVAESLETIPPVEEGMKVKNGTIEYEDGIMIGLDGTMEAKPVDVPIPPDKVTSAVRGYLSDIAFDGVNAQGVPGGIGWPNYDEFFGQTENIVDDGAWEQVVIDLDRKLKRVNQILDLSKDNPEVRQYFTEVKTLLEQAKANRDYQKYLEATKKLFELGAAIR